MQLNQPGSIQKMQGTSVYTARTDWQGNANVTGRTVTHTSV